MAGEYLKFGGVRHATLIGGGDLMLETARACRERSLEVSVLLAPRFVAERLPLGERSTKEAFEEAGFVVDVVDDINAWPELDTYRGAGPEAVALCFGPAWIFRRAVVERFGFGMHNFNGIPIPRYLGGAHYTWQILNDDRTGGCNLQEITLELDRGPLLRRESFEHSPNVRTPWDYFVSNHERGTAFIHRLLDDMRADVPFPRIPWANVESERLYFPRLHTLQNGYVDWAWNATEIETFCRAFDRPYPGACTMIEGVEVHLTDVALLDEQTRMHPFCAGLVVRSASDHVVIAVREGLLRVNRLRTRDGQDALPLAKEGRRLHTPSEVLAHARTSRPHLGATGFKPNEPPKNR